MPKFGCWKERKQFEDERACESWAAYGQGWEDVILQVCATTVASADVGARSGRTVCPWGNTRRMLGVGAG